MPTMAETQSEFVKNCANAMVPSSHTNCDDRPLSMTEIGGPNRAVTTAEVTRI
jgi:hypothetical protein